MIFTMWVCGKLLLDGCGNVEILWVSLLKDSRKCLNSPNSMLNRTIWNGVVTPVLCGKKVLAIDPFTFFIVYDNVQRTYAVCYGFLIAVIQAKCNVAETGLPLPIRWSLIPFQVDLRTASLL